MISFDALDRATLTPLVRAALHDPAAEPIEWHWAPIAYDVYLPGRALARFAGTAVVAGSVRPWSIVLKRTQPQGEGDRASDKGWKREALAYRSGLLADIPGPLAAPRALAVTEDVDGATRLWLEEVADRFNGAWPLAQYAQAADHLGQFNGAYLTGYPLPTASWLLSDWAELHAQPAKRAEALSHIGALALDARVRRAFPIPIADYATRLLDDAPTFVEILARLPQVLCHHDASQANLFARRHADGLVETVAIDWEYVGPGAIGAEIAPLVLGTMRRGTFPAERAVDLDRAAFAAYLQGLHVAGWHGDPGLVRLGYTAAVALRWSVLYSTLCAVTDDGARSRLARMLKAPEERAVQQFTFLSLFLLDCADEARTLAHQAGPAG